MLFTVKIFSWSTPEGNSLASYIKSNPDIRDPQQYVRSSLQSWLDDWALRYQDLGE